MVSYFALSFRFRMYTLLIPVYFYHRPIWLNNAPISSKHSFDVTYFLFFSFTTLQDYPSLQVRPVISPLFYLLFCLSVAFSHLSFLPFSLYSLRLRVLLLLCQFPSSLSYCTNSPFVSLHCLSPSPFSLHPFLLPLFQPFLCVIPSIYQSLFVSLLVSFPLPGCRSVVSVCFVFIHDNCWLIVVFIVTMFLLPCLLLFPLRYK